MSVLQDNMLAKLARNGAIDPFEPANVQAASIDLRLGTSFRVPDRHRHAVIDLANVPDDMTKLVTVGPQDASGFLLFPGDFALGETVEKITVPDDCVGRLEGKSSLGRLGLMVHVTAGFFDPGFSGRGTLEFVNLLDIPIRLRPGLPICQFSFHQLLAPAGKPYAGRYQGDGGVAPSRYGRPPVEWCPECQAYRNREMLLIEQLVAAVTKDAKDGANQRARENTEERERHEREAHSNESVLR